MEGVCVFRDNRDCPNLLMYKEINLGKIFYFKYNKYNNFKGTISIFDFYKIVPKNNIHILYNLPILHDIDETLELWKKLTLNRLNILNKIPNIIYE